MRGGTHCVGSTVPPIVKLNPAGKQLLTFGAGLFVMPHGLYVDNDNNVWVTDADGKDGKGPSARPVSGAVGPDTFNRPSDVVTAPNGDIFEEGIRPRRVRYAARAGDRFQRTPAGRRSRQQPRADL